MVAQDDGYGKAFDVPQDLDERKQIEGVLKELGIDDAENYKLERIVKTPVSGEKKSVLQGTGSAIKIIITTELQAAYCGNLKHESNTQEGTAEISYKEKDATVTFKLRRVGFLPR